MRTKRIVFRLVTGLVILLLAASVYAEGAKSIAIALNIKGNVQVKKAGTENWIPLKFGAVLDGGDKITTGKESFAALVFTDDKSQLKLRPNTEITLNAERNDDYSLKKRINMDIGELFAEVKKQKGSLQVATPTAVASVKGTQFWTIVLSDGSTQTLTLEGIVNLLSLITGQDVDVVAGQLGAVGVDGEIDLSIIEDSSLPELLEELDIEHLRLEFIDEDGSRKSLIIQYRSGNDD